MSDILIISAIFLGGSVLVGAVFALDEIAAALGLQPRSKAWELAPLCPPEETDRTGSDGNGPGCRPAEGTGRKPGPRISLGYTPGLSGLPAPSE